MWLLPGREILSGIGGRMRTVGEPETILRRRGIVKRYLMSEKGKAMVRRYRTSEKGIAARRRRAKSASGRATQNRYRRSSEVFKEKRRAADKRRYHNNPKRRAYLRAKQREYRARSK